MDGARGCRGDKNCRCVLVVFIDNYCPTHISPSVVDGLIGRVEVLLVRVGECEGVLGESEGRLTECGPIGADLDRLAQQQEILDISEYI